MASKEEYATTPELSAWNVEDQSVSDDGPIGVVGQENGFGIGVDEFPDQPSTGNSVDLRFLSRHPSHEARSKVIDSIVM